MPFSNVIYIRGILTLFAKDKMNRELMVKKAVETALKTNSFEIHYQPIYNVQNGLYTKAEALLRLYDNELGRISPCEFIPLAEKKGYIKDIGYYVLDKACAFFRKNCLSGLDYISVNASALQFEDPQFADRALEIAQYNHVNPRHIFIELTESMNCNRFKQLEANMKKLHKHGFSISLDDFGKGFADIRSMMSLPISAVKIDKCYVDKLEEPSARLLIKGLIGLAKRLDLKVIAEGVETRIQKHALIELECDFLQGYYFSKPLTECETEKILKQNIRTAL